MNALHLGYVSQMLENVIRKAFLQFLKSGAATVWECSGRDWADLNNSRRRPDCMTMLGGVVRFFMMILPVFVVQILLVKLYFAKLRSNIFKIAS